MNLSGFFRYGNKNTDNRRTETVRSVPVSSSDKMHVKQATKSVTPGQVLQGEIVEKSGNEVKLRLDKDVVITARLDRDINLTVGQSVTFEVQSGQSGSQIALRPLYENLAHNANVLKALEAARLPVTDEWMRMVSTMMEQGMSIDKNTLLDMGKLVMANGNVNPETIVALRSLNIPITPESIEQFENYSNYRHQLLTNVTDFLSQLPSAFESLVKDGQMDAAIRLYQQVLEMFTQTSLPEGTGNGGNTSSLATPELLSQGVSEAGSPASLNSQGSGNEAGMNTLQQVQSNMADSVINLVGAGDDAILTTQGGDGSKGNTPNVPVNTLSVIAEENDGQLLRLLGVNDRNALLSLLEGIGFSKEQLMGVLDGSISAKQLLQDISQLLASNGDMISKENLAALFGSKGYQLLLKHEVMDEWLMKPSDVGNKGRVEDFYGRLREQSARLTEALGQMAKDIPLSKSLTVIQNNIDFMHQLNQAFNYIQLPLKLSGGEAHGDLYVYTNRRSTANEDGSVSALLHLDMQSLGPIDVYVSMRENNVSTKFYLKDEHTIDFVADHIHILNERLTKKGYSMKAEMVMSEKEGGENVIETITASEGKENILAQYSFDVRA